MLEKNIANIITGLRIILGLCLIFFLYDSKQFMIIYSCAILSDVLDGFIARRLNIESKFGSRLDSVADLFLLSILLIKAYGFITLNFSILIIVLTVALIKMLNYIVFALTKHRFLSNHSILNKIAGVLVYLFPFSSYLNCFNIYCIVTSLVSLLASLDETRLIFKKENI